MHRSNARTHPTIITGFGSNRSGWRLVAGGSFGRLPRTDETEAQSPVTSRRTASLGGPHRTHALDRIHAAQCTAMDGFTGRDRPSQQQRQAAAAASPSPSPSPPLPSGSGGAIQLQVSPPGRRQHAADDGGGSSSRFPPLAPYGPFDDEEQESGRGGREQARQPGGEGAPASKAAAEEEQVSRGKRERYWDGLSL